MKASDELNTELHPIDSLQFEQLIIEWVPYASVRPNKWNPNRMTRQDRDLLRQSLLEDGWTQPVVTLRDGTIVDGEQRWTTAGLPLTSEQLQAIIDKQLKRAAQGAMRRSVYSGVRH